jgi:helix-turn-helix protein
MEIRDRTTQEIEDDIRVARSEGGSLREIGLIVGMSHTEIRRIINKEMGAAS